MPRLIWLLGILSLTACASGRKGILTIMVPTDAPTADVVSCARDVLVEIGYEIEEGDDPATVRARKKISGLGQSIIGQSRYSGLLVEVDEPDAPGLRFAVTAFTTEEIYWGRGRDTYGPPTKNGEAEANTLLARCAPDQVPVEAPA